MTMNTTTTVAGTPDMITNSTSTSNNWWMLYSIVWSSFYKTMKEYELLSAFSFLWTIARDVWIPLIVTILLATYVFKALQWLQLHVFLPPSKAYPKRYIKAKRLYCLGCTAEALKEWSQLKTYGPAILSRACHALYVLGDAELALSIVREINSLKHDDTNKNSHSKQKLPQKPQPTRRKVMSLDKSMVKQIQLDAQALQTGHNTFHMIDMNARLAKQEYLGINTL